MQKSIYLYKPCPFFQIVSQRKRTNSRRRGKYIHMGIFKTIVNDLWLQLMKLTCFTGNILQSSYKKWETSHKHKKNGRHSSWKHRRYLTQTFNCLLHEFIASCINSANEFLDRFSLIYITLHNTNMLQLQLFCDQYCTAIKE